MSWKFLTHRVSQQTTLCNFPKIFIPLNLLLISLTVQVRAISSTFSTHRVSKKCAIGNFQKKKILSPKMAAILNFRIFAKNGKNTNLLLSPRDRAILSKLLTHWVSQRTILCNFQKISSPQTMVAILNFQILAKTQKHKFASISLTVRDRAILSKLSTHWVSQRTTLQFSKKFPLPQKWWPF